MCAIMGFSKKTYTKEELLPFFDRTRSRGPDMSQILETPSGWLCFHRLAIMGLTEAGMQPFELDGDYVVCNGEIYVSSVPVSVVVSDEPIASVSVVHAGVGGERVEQGTVDVAGGDDLHRAGELGSGVLRLVGRLRVISLRAAGDQREHHHDAKQQRKQLFHN